MAFYYMDDCIHLKACRRLQKIGKSKGHIFTRSCNTECSAYCSANQGEYLTPYEACDIARRQYDGNRDTGDVYCLCDFPTKTLSEILEGHENE